MVTVSIPSPGQQAHSPAIPLAEKVRVTLPQIALRPGRYRRVTLQWRVERGGIGVPGASWRLGKGPGIEEEFTLPEPPKGAEGIQLALFTEIEAASGPIDAVATLE